MIDTLLNALTLLAILVGIFATGLALHELTHAVVAYFYTDIGGIAICYGRDGLEPLFGAFVAVEDSNAVIAFAPLVWFIPPLFLPSGTLFMAFVSLSCLWAGFGVLLSDLPSHFGLLDVDYENLTILPILELQPFETWELDE